MIITPMSTLISAVSQLTPDESLTGCVAAGQEDSVTMREPPGYIGDNTKKSVELISALAP